MPDFSTTLPRSLLARSRIMRLGSCATPTLMIHPNFTDETAVCCAAAPVLLWLHGRTAQKELDSGRYLRLLRAGIATVALDLPGHGERRDESLQTAEKSLQVIEMLLQELPLILQALKAFPEFDLTRCAIGGFSLGAMAALTALTQPHSFCAALIEATTGDWSQLVSAQFDHARAERLEPLKHIDSWKPIPLLALHASEDQIVPVALQRKFIQHIRERTPTSMPVLWHEFAHTGAPQEHIGFGTSAVEAKSIATRFLVEQLRPSNTNLTL